jgi:hypothetical protein
VLGEVDFPHPAFAQELFEPILAEFAGRPRLFAQFGNLVRTVDGQRHPDTQPDGNLRKLLLQRLQVVILPRGRHRDEDGTQGHETDDDDAPAPRVRDEDPVNHEQDEPAQHAALDRQVEDVVVVEGGPPFLRGLRGEQVELEIGGKGGPGPVQKNLQDAQGAQRIRPPAPEDRR